MESLSKWLVAGLLVGAATAAVAGEPRALRSRELVVRPEVLRNTTKPGDLVPLEMFDDPTDGAVLENRTEDRLNGLVWRGRLADYEDGWVILVEHDGVMAGVVSDGERLFRIGYVGGGRHVIEEIDPRSLAKSTNDAVVPDALAPETQWPLQAEAAFDPDAGVETLTEIDVLMVYTRKAARHLVKNRHRYFWIEESAPRRAIESQARLAIAVANAALENSRVQARLRLVAVTKIAGKGTSNSSRDLARLAEPDDGRFDKAHVLRQRLGADFVVMLVGKASPELGGIGYIVPATHPVAPNLAFSIVRSSALWWTTVAHEIGHNMGLVHDPDHDTTPAFARSHPYSRGYRNEAMGLATLMAYEDGCAACWLNIPHYSNPKVRWAGDTRPSHPRLVQPSCQGDEPANHPDIQFPVCGVKTGSGGFNAAKSIHKDRKIFAAFRPCEVDCRLGE
ncbi:MAG: M12 family metallo-peptidase [Acidobacteriota bacterium]